MNIPKQHRYNKTNEKRDNATVNKSMLNQLNPANTYRFFCLSLFRSDYYSVKLRIKDLAAITGEKETALKNFNKDIEEVLTRKKYPVPINHPVYDYTMRSVYSIPPIDYPNFITLSHKLTEVNLSVKVKGYYIKLLLMAEKNLIALTSKTIAAKLNMDKKTVEGYNIGLYSAGLLKFTTEGLELTPKEILLSNDEARQCKVWIRSYKNPLPNITLNGKK